MGRDARRVFAITVTAIIATYNRADYLRESLASVVAQTHAPDQIIVVNDGSTDDTEAVLSEFAASIEVINQDNRGKPAALNRALPAVTSSHVWIFDDDDFALPNALADHVAFLDQNPALTFSYSRNFTFDGDADIRFRERWRRGTYTLVKHKPLLLALLYDCELIFQALLVPARCFAELGYFDETLARAEDYDMLIKLARRYRGGFNDTETMVWRNHSGDRGAPGQLHVERDRTFWFRYYERRIFAAVWNDFALAEYLPLAAGASSPDNLSPLQAQRARLQRSEIMFVHDLPGYASVDLAAVVADAPNGSTLFNEAVAVARRAADVGDPVFVASARQRARQLARAVSVARAPWPLAVAACKGFYWSIARGWRKQRVGDVVSMARAALVFTGALAVYRLRRGDRRTGDFGLRT